MTDMQYRSPAVPDLPADQEAVWRVSVVGGLENIALIQDEWRAMCERVQSGVPNCNVDRFVATLEALAVNGVLPHVVLFHRNDELVCMLVGRTETRRVSWHAGYFTLKSPKLRCLDIVYGGVIARADDVESRAQVVKYLVGYLEAATVDHVMINHLNVEEPLSLMLKSALKGSVLAPKTESHWHLRFEAGGWSANLAKFSKKHRYNIRRMHSKLSEHSGGDLEVRLYRRADQLSEFVGAAAGIARQTYQARLGAGFEDTALWRRVLETEAEKGRLRCHVLFSKGIPIAYQIGTVYGGRYNLECIGYVPAFREFSPGTVLLLQTFEEISADGCSIVDYGFGDADYKRVYGTSSVNEAVFHLYGRGVRAKISRRIELVVMGCARWSSDGIAKTGSLRALKRLWRSHLSK